MAAANAFALHESLEEREGALVGLGGLGGAGVAEP